MTGVQTCALRSGVCEDRVFLLSEIERLRRQCAEVNEECSTRVLAAQKFQMDVAQIVNDYIDHEVVYEPDPSWPPEDVRRSIINIIASEKAS